MRLVAKLNALRGKQKLMPPLPKLLALHVLLPKPSPPLKPPLPKVAVEVPMRVFPASPAEQLKLPAAALPPLAKVLLLPHPLTGAVPLPEGLRPAVCRTCLA